MNKPAAEFYIKFMGEIQGPFTPDQVRMRAQTGRLLPDTHIRKGAEGNWVTADRIKGLSFGSNKTAQAIKSTSLSATPNLQRLSPKPNRLKYVIAGVCCLFLLTTIGLLALLLVNAEDKATVAGTTVIAQQKIENVASPQKSKDSAVNRPSIAQRTTLPNGQITTDQTTEGSIAKPDEPPINPAELRGDTAGAAYLFALHDNHNDISLITRTATEPYLNQITMLTRAFGLTGEEIGNAILASTEVMNEANVEYRFSEILNAMLTLDVLENAKLSELLATYSVFRAKGESHNDTVRQLNALLTALKDKRSELQGERSMETGRPDG